MALNLPPMDDNDADEAAMANSPAATSVMNQHTGNGFNGAARSPVSTPPLNNTVPSVANALAYARVRRDP